MSQPNEGQDRLDYRETSDITEVHASVLREHAEPRAGSMPIPTWLGVLCAAALTWAGVYIGIFHGGFSGKVYNEYESNPAAFFPLKGGQQGGGSAAELPLLALGEKIYGANCVSCHQANGMGNPGGQIPPLAGSEWVDGAEYGDKRLIAIVLKGLKGPISVKGANFNGVMPNIGTSLKPRQVAAVLTFIRQAWGNKGTGEITEAQVLAAKKDPQIAEQLENWTAEQIKAMPAGNTLGGGTDASVASAAPAPGATPVPGSTPAAAAAGQASVPTPQAPAAAAPASAGTFDIAASINRGKPIYMQTCMACHQATGLGLPPAFPPLVETEYVTGSTRRLIAIALKGIQGPLTVNGKPFVGVMPPPGAQFPQLKDDKNMADVLNYVRNSFGNKAAEPVTPELVGKVRAEVAGDPAMFTEETLKNFK
jgi:mono/diheme cytochrome c family protein